MKDRILHIELIDKLQLSYSSKSFLVLYDTKTYKVGEILYCFIEYLKIHNIDDALKIVSTRFGIDAKDQDVLIENLKTLLKTLNVEEISKNYINLKRVLFNERITDTIAGKLKFAFSKKVLLTILPIALLSNVLFFILNGALVYDSINLGFYEIITFYFSIFFILIGHEFGHSAACKFFDIKPKEIGIGIYILFPVLYSNVSGIWVLSKMKRIIVNIAGIYFQLIFNVFLFLLYYYLSNYNAQGVVLTLIRVNTFIYLYSLLPFIRNDGYWIYSDYFEIPNLNKESNRFPVLVFRNILKKQFDFFERGNIWLALYSLGNYIFILYILSTIVSFLVTVFNKIILIDFTKNITLVLREFEPFLFGLVVSVVILYFLLKSFTIWIKTTFVLNKNMYDL